MRHKRAALLAACLLVAAGSGSDAPAAPVGDEYKLRIKCGEIPCSEWRADARWTGRFALVISGHLRTVEAKLPSLRALVDAHKPARVDV